MMVTIEKHSDNYGPRLALRFPFVVEAKDQLKAELPFPQVKWVAAKKAWSIQDEPGVIKVAADVLTSHGMDCSALYDLIQGVEARNPNEPWVEVKKRRLFLHWPFIADKDLRDGVRMAVKAISNYKWDPNTKHWSIPVQQATVLYGLLENMYPPLATAIMECEHIKDDIEASIGRVEMSSAAELQEVDAAELDRRLSESLPDGFELYPFQKVGVAFAEAAHGRCLIGDDMGVGKTIQALAYASLYPNERPLLVVCPSNVKYNWEKEAKLWLPNESVHVINSVSTLKAQDVKDFASSLGANEAQVRTRGTAEKYLKGKGVDIKTYIPDSQVLIINYDILENFSVSLSRLAPQMAVFDESHYIKHKTAQRTSAAISVGRLCPKVLALSGTAISSRPKEFFNTLNLISPATFTSEWDFKNRYCDPWFNGFGWDFSGASNTQELNERTRDICIRRLKKEVLAELPEKVRQFIPLNLRREDREDYDLKHEEYMHTMDTHAALGESLPKGFALQMIQDLRHTCGRLKVPSAVSWIHDYHANTHKPIVVFCHHKDVLEGIRLGMMPSRKYNGLRTGVISGDVSASDRAHLVGAFQAGELDVLLCNTMAAKEGITLTAADTVLFVEREWVPTDEEQAEDRVYRIGQESQSVHAVYLSLANTIDEHFDRVVEDKRQVVKAVLDGGDVEERKTLVKELVQRLRQERGWKLEE